MRFSARAIDGKQIPVVNTVDRVSGQYSGWIKEAGFDRDSSVLNVWLLKDGQVRIVG